MTKNTGFIFILVIAAIALGNAGSTLYLPAMPVIGKDLNSTASLMRLSLSLFLIGFGVSQLIYGPLSDAFGRKKILILGLVIFFIGSLISACALNINYLLLGRLVEGLGIGAVNAVGYALLRDIYSGHKLTLQLGYLSVFVGVTPLVAPIIGGYLTVGLSWRACFYFLALMAVLVISAKIFFLPETNSNINTSAIQPRFIIKNYQTLLGSRVFLGFSLATAFAFAAVFTMGSLLPFLLVNDLGIRVSIYAWIAGIPAIGYLLGSFVGGKFSAQFGLFKLIILGALIQLISGFLGILLTWNGFNIYSLMIPLFFLLLGVGMIIPTGSSGAMAPFPKLAGSESALLCAFMFAFAAVFTAIGAHINVNSAVPVFCLLGSIGIFVLIFLGLAKS